jgi:hypothetical protein
MVRNSKSRVEDPADQVVECFIVGERLMATFMGNDPQACSEKACGKAVEGPDSETGERVEGERICVRSGVVCAGNDDDIPEDIG